MRFCISAAIVAAAILLCGPAFGQMKTLKEGDVFPDISFENVYNYSKPKLRFSELRPKLVILDFWSTNCMSCIKAFPKLESLKQEFADQIEIVMVTQESKVRLDSFLAKRSKIKLPDAILLTSDTLLNKIFPRASVALNVWIDSKGKISFITEGFETNSLQVGAFLKEDSIELTKFRGRPTYKKTLFSDDAENSLLYFSYLSHYNHVNIGHNFDLGGVSISERGLSAVELFVIAFNERWKNGFHRPNRVILEIEDSFKYVRQKGSSGRLGEWFDHYCYNYQLLLPENKRGEEYKIMQQDLLRYFDLEARVEKRSVPAYNLIRTGQADYIATKGGKPFSSFSQNAINFNDFGPVRKIVNKPFSIFHNLLNGFFEYKLGTIILDNVNYKGNIDIEVPGYCLDKLSNDIESFGCLLNELNKYGLGLVPTEIEIDVLIISQKKIKGR